MQEATGDCWELALAANADAVCVLTNMTVGSWKEYKERALVMGGGQAREAREIYEELPERWGARYDRFWRNMEEGDAPTPVLIEPKETLSGPMGVKNPFAVVSFPTKTHPSEESNLNLVRRGAYDLVAIAGVNEWKNIICPRPGCGLGGLDWNTQVKPLLEPIWDDRFTVVTFKKK